jgi:hypothetical protein
LVAVARFSSTGKSQSHQRNRRRMTQAKALWKDFQSATAPCPAKAQVQRRCFVRCNRWLGSKNELTLITFATY